MPSATTAQDLGLIAPGSRVIVRDLEWQVVEKVTQAMGTKAIVRCVGRSELVRDQPASFFSDLDEIRPEDPKRTTFRVDASPNGIETRLALESLVRRTPVPISNTDVTVGHAMLADDLPYQREPFRAAMAQLQPRLLIADAVGLGKTIEVALLLAELQRRGRAVRILAVVPKHILDQVQHELWCRAGIPLVRLDSDGIRRMRDRIPTGRNPFTYFNRVIVSIDTLKSPSLYRHHLEKVRWDVVWVDESHKLVNKGTQNSQLAHVLAPQADALILSSATPHNGKPEAFAQLIDLLDPTAVTDPEQVTPEDIAHLVVRRHKHSPDVEQAIADQWAERAEPLPIMVTPSPEEEAVFAELSKTWIGPGISPPCEDRLFPWTLLKAGLSSPAALAETVESRASRKHFDLLKPSPDPEAAALRQLHLLATAARDSRPQKLAALIDTLKQIGVGKRSATRVVIFSERIKTLEWIAEHIRSELAMSEEQVKTFHNSLPDDEQERVVQDFAMASVKLRVLVASDIASEGVNLHQQCHHLIHVDLPWSLITLEQRNGRIDRYKQLHRPQIRYLVYQPRDEEVASDMRIVSKLIAKEHAAHKALGDVSSVMGLHSESDEEQAVAKALQQRTAKDREQALEEAAPTKKEFDPWGWAGLDASEPHKTAIAEVPIRPIPTLFAGDDDYFEQAVSLAFPSPAVAVGWETDGKILSFKPPEDLMRRLGALPQSYLRQRNLTERLRLTADAAAANQSLSDAINQRGGSDSGTAWPEVHHLGPQHPVLEWIADKLLYRLKRDEAIAIACGVTTPTLLVSGVWPNRLGEPIAADWLAATVEDGMPVFSDLHETLAAAGVRAGMVNPTWNGDTEPARQLVGPVVTAAESRLTDLLLDQLAPIEEQLNQTKARLERWQAEARSVAAGMRSEVHKRRRLEEIEGRAKQMEALLLDYQPAEAPLVRIVGALLPKASA